MEFKNWTDAKKQRWRDMWRGELGQDALAMLEELKQGYIDEAIANAAGGGNAIDYRIQQAAGIDTAIQMIKSTAKL